ncbi:hypothetical protein AJ80_09698 [Polytolypa hystricis UAMH7299]|uniref:Uncharacterized protein n=1 Tax=Polytolypa hystricis (strain UAMH7299) TaxID=1447883 RepID=A0A2B7WLT1_POLH7|nr:hypothetical protein AJ80_09698 [Polytolypa hystricis UAMH7299]
MASAVEQSNSDSLLLTTSLLENSKNADASSLQAEVLKKLTELRIFLEQGVQPLEGKLKYQVDKVLKAAEDAERSKKQSSPDSDEDDSEDDSEIKSGSEEDSGAEEDEPEINVLAYRPNLSAFAKGKDQDKAKTKSDKTDAAADGIYRPPKIKPTALPESTPSHCEEQEACCSAKSRVIDKFVSAEMSSAPLAEPSISSTICADGRTVAFSDSTVLLFVVL